MKKLFWFSITLVFSACSVNLVLTSNADLKRMQEKVPGMTLEKANEGKRLYFQRCASCHHLYEPSKYTEKEWSDILGKMLPKAKIKNVNQQQLIKDYLISLSR